MAVLDAPFSLSLTSEILQPTQQIFLATDTSWSGPSGPTVLRWNLQCETGADVLELGEVGLQLASGCDCVCDVDGTLRTCGGALCGMEDDTAENFPSASGVASGIFNNCTGGNGSFGAGGKASGTFTSCIGGDQSFGYDGTASGTFANCTGGDQSFGHDGDATGGRFYYCSGGTTSFTTTGSPVAIDCIRDGVLYP